MVRNMRLRKLKIRNYRGIRECDWDIDSRFVALIGAGDSTKTTVMDAIGLALSSRYSITFTDADFYNSDVSNPIVIEATVVDLPDSLVEERAHGKNRSGIDSGSVLHHDPLSEDDIVECLTIRLTVDQTLEPIWEVVRPEEAEGSPITASQRSQLGFFRIGDYVDAHLRWGRSSALSALTASKPDATYAVVEAQRQARAAVSDLAGTPLHVAAEFAQTEVSKLGGGPFKDLRPGIDPQASAGTASLVLHDGNVPLTQFGLGSRRLLSLSIQENALAGGSIVAIDEIESGLEPYRLSHLVKHLKAKVEDEELQVIFTTHSSLVVESLLIGQMFIIRCDTDGLTTIVPVPPELSSDEADVVQGIARERPSSLLSRKVIVGEGATEVGVLRAFLWSWDSKRTKIDEVNSVTAGISVANGSGGSQAPGRARALAQLGYPTLLVIDGDVTSNATQIAAAVDVGALLVQWPKGQALEDVICESLSLAGLQKYVDFAVEDRSEESIVSSVNNFLSSCNISGANVAGWITDANEIDVRTAIAKASKGAKADGTKIESKAWFKREDRGESLGAIVVADSEGLKEGALLTGIDKIKKFAYDLADSAAEAE